MYRFRKCCADVYSIYINECEHELIAEPTLTQLVCGENIQRIHSPSLLHVQTSGPPSADRSATSATTEDESLEGNQLVQREGGDTEAQVGGVAGNKDCEEEEGDKAEVGHKHSEQQKKCNPKVLMHTAPDPDSIFAVKKTSA